MIRPGPRPTYKRRTVTVPAQWVRPERISGATAAGVDILTAADTASQKAALGLGDAADMDATDFAAAVHTHAQADVTGLVAALGNKAAFSHSHDAADIATGQIDASRVDVDKTAFAGSLGTFTGTTAQELFDFIDANLT
jgi:hypothetical protein